LIESIHESKGALHVGLPLRYWLIDKYQKIYASVLINYGEHHSRRATEYWVPF